MLSVKKATGGIFAFFKSAFTQESPQTKAEEKYYIVNALKINDDKLYISTDTNCINVIRGRLKHGSFCHIRDFIERGEKNKRGEKYETVMDVKKDNRTINYIELNNNTIEVSGDIDFAIECLKNNHLCSSKDIFVDKRSPNISTACKLV